MTGFIIFPKNADFAAISMNHIENRLECCCFSGTVAADKTHDIALFQIKRNIFQMELLIIFIQVFIRRSAGFTVRRSVMEISYSSMTEICIETSSFGRSPRNVSQF